MTLSRYLSTCFLTLAPFFNLAGYRFVPLIAHCLSVTALAYVLLPLSGCSVGLLLLPSLLLCGAVEVTFLLLLSALPCATAPLLRGSASGRSSLAALYLVPISPSSRASSRVQSSGLVSTRLDGAQGRCT